MAFSTARTGVIDIDTSPHKTPQTFQHCMTSVCCRSMQCINGKIAFGFFSLEFLSSYVGLIKKIYGQQGWGRDLLAKGKRSRTGTVTQSPDSSDIDGYEGG